MLAVALLWTFVVAAGSLIAIAMDSSTYFGATTTVHLLLSGPQSSSIPPTKTATTTTTGLNRSNTRFPDNERATKSCLPLKWEEGEADGARRDQANGLLSSELETKEELVVLLLLLLLPQKPQSNGPLV